MQQPQSLLAFVVVLLVLSVAVDATCFCPIIWDNNTRHIGGCNDSEMQAECQRAEFEYRDLVSAYMGFADAIILAKLQESPPVTARWVARNRAALSFAVERRFVADCATGVFTTTLNPYTQTHCFSPELLHQCEQALEASTAYPAGVIQALRDQDASSDFISLMQTRVRMALVKDDVYIYIYMYIYIYIYI